MDISIKTNFDLSQLDVDQIMTIGIHNSARELQSMARKNAPYDTGKLKQGIGIEETKQTGRIGPRNIPYALRREYENKKNPHKKFYMKRTFDASKNIVQKNFDNAFQIVSKKIS